MDEALKGLVISKNFPNYDTTECKWIHLISFEPCMVAICLPRNSEAYKNIKKSMEFGVEIVALNQNFNLQMETEHMYYKAKKIDVFLSENAILSIECKVVKIVEDMGENPIFIAEGVELSEISKEKYFEINDRLIKPNADFIQKLERSIEKYIIH